MTAKFDLGQVVATPGALKALEDAGQEASFFLDEHASGNWGSVNAEDWRLNDEALLDGGRLFSVYRTLKGIKLWVITEAADDDGTRSSTCLLTPNEY